MAEGSSHTSVAKENEKMREAARAAAFWEAIDYLKLAGFPEAAAALEADVFAEDDPEPVHG